MRALTTIAGRIAVDGCRRPDHYTMLQRNLLYTGITQAKRLVVLGGTPKAVAIAVKRADAGRRYSALPSRLRNLGRSPFS